ncbi:hypothetical protein ABZS71_14665 [Streptomyces sp. NPDC005393]|uniref:hypothetical protein n=1 Tax=Streptomyces sp. NPDC005393 TaxID=3157041 RepID=UPI0033ABC5CA
MHVTPAHPVQDPPPFVELDLAAVHALFSTAAVNSSGQLARRELLTRWLEEGWHIAFYRAADGRLFVRKSNPTQSPDTWAFMDHALKVPLESAYLDPRWTARAEPAKEFRGEEDDPLGDGFDWVPEPDRVPGVVPAHSAVLHRSTQDWELTLEGSGAEGDTPVLTIPIRQPAAAAHSDSSDPAHTAALLDAGTAALHESGYSLIDGWERETDHWYDYIQASHVPERWGHQDTVLDEGAYATLVPDEVKGWHLLVNDVRSDRWWGADASEVWVDEFLQLDDPLEDVTEWDPAWLLTLLDSALHAAGYRIDFERPSQRHTYVAVTKLTQDDAAQQPLPSD